MLVVHVSTVAALVSTPQVGGGGRVGSLALGGEARALAAYAKKSGRDGGMFGVGKKMEADAEASHYLRRWQKRQPMKVALLVEPTPFTHVCGYANRFKEMLRYLRELGDTEVAIATPDDKVEAPREFAGFEVSTIPGLRLPMYPEVCLTGDLRGEAKRMVERFKPDLIHVSSPGILCLPAILYSKLMRIPLVMSYHTHLPVYAEKYTSWLPFSRHSAWRYIKAVHSYADLTLVTSPQMLEEFVEQKIKRVAVWRKGVDVDVFNPQHRDPVARSLLTDSEGPVLLYVGRLSVEKRLEDLAVVLDECPDCSLALVGGGPHERELRNYFRRFGDRVKFLGVLRGAALSKAYASADIFCMPSDSETLGFVVIEAMASGLAVVGADAGGIPSIIDDARNGLLSTPRDPHHLAHLVKQIVESPDLRRDLATRARKDAEGWGWKAATTHLRDVQYPAAIRRHAAMQKRADKFKARKKALFTPTMRRVLRRVFFDRFRLLSRAFSPRRFLNTFTTKYRLATAGI
ncbi:hypothetical protein CTAYLR_000930 [Chrysophaeum taylorii]|uniref:Uncharacterized protein n=1 Tax=Chrysophaeum taylorii TaxID=2483200 RepID=A0AAD7XMJ9_9STRA|nr:hypothetical protein CTAYLR_000930 [Chrysophaeum taylorii]